MGNGLLKSKWIYLSGVIFGLGAAHFYPQAVYVSVLFLALLFIRLAIDTSLLRDISKQENINRPFSFARVQLSFWTFLILSGYIIIYIQSGSHLDILTPGVLIILGISVGTSASGNIIDTSDVKIESQDSSMVRSQDNKSNGFMVDILSDKNGISIHRLQALIFNIVFGAVLVNSVFSSDQSLPDFEQNELILLGISSGTYVALKATENKANTPSKK